MSIGALWRWWASNLGCGDDGPAVCVVTGMPLIITLNMWGLKACQLLFTCLFVYYLYFTLFLSFHFPFLSSLSFCMSFLSVFLFYLLYFCLSSFFPSLSSFLPFCLPYGPSSGALRNDFPPVVSVSIVLSFFRVLSPSSCSPGAMLFSLLCLFISVLVPLVCLFICLCVCLFALEPSVNSTRGSTERTHLKKKKRAGSGSVTTVSVCLRDF